MKNQAIQNDQVSGIKSLPTMDRGKSRPRILFVGEAVTLAHITRPLVLIWGQSALGAGSPPTSA